LEEQDLNPNSFAFRSHEKQTGGLELLKALLAAHYPVPTDMRKFILYGQLNQADALKTAVTHWRSRMWKTSGCLIWQLNDCWPVVSWSLIDYGLTAKSSYYAVKRACQPVISPIIVKNGIARVYVVNETADNLELDINFGAFKFSGEALYECNKHSSVSAFTSLPVFELPLNSLNLTQDSFLTVTAKDTDMIISEDTKLAFEPKDTCFPNSKIKVQVKKTGIKTFEATMQGLLYAKSVYLGVGDVKAEWSDNFFDLLPHKAKTVFCSLELDLSAEQFEKALTVQVYPYA
jgi:beta-mannosidase